MRSLHEAGGAGEAYSPAEELFNRRRRTVGLFLGPAVLAALLIAPLPIPAPAHRLAAILAMMVVLWVTEALPLPVTALIGPVLAVILQVGPARTVLAPFADPIIFLFIGSFMLAEAMFSHGLDRRIAFGALSSRAVGASPTRILLVFGGVATAISMWISNTATTAMMFPIGLSIVAHVTHGRESETASRNFATAMMLIAAFGASIGGIGTPIGTPPNLIGKGMLERIAHVRISFFEWMLFGVPVAAVLFGFLVVYFRCRLLSGLVVDASRTAYIQEELRKLGPLGPGQRNTLIAFGVTVALWLFPGVLAIAGLADSGLARAYEAAVPESVAAMIGGDPAVPPAGELAGTAVHADLGSGRADRLGHHPALRRRARDGRAGVLDRARRIDRTRGHRLAAGAVHGVVDDSLHRRRNRDVGGGVEHRRRRT